MAQQLERIIPLRIRGLSKTNFDDQPLLAHGHDFDYATTKVSAAGHETEAHDPSSEIEACPVTPPMPGTPDAVTSAEEAARSRSMPESVGWSFGTGNMSARSSIFSWENDDEYDRQASATVRKMFDDIDSLLYEDHATGSRQLTEECSVWASAFPHLRLLGQQLIKPLEDGTQLVSRDSGGETARDPAHAPLMDIWDNGKETMQRLSISGVTTIATEAPTTRQLSTEDTRSSSFSASDSDFSYLHEEVFAQDGDYEECIARDAYPITVDKCGDSRGHDRAMHHGIPSVTPTAVVRETIIDDFFDRIWAEAVPLLVDLLLFCIRTTRAGGSKRGSASFSHDASAKIAAAFRSQSQLKASASALTLPVAHTASDVGALKELMTIRSVALQQRAPSVASNIFRYDDQATDVLLAQSSDFNRRPFTSQTHNGLPIADAKSMPRPLSVRNSTDHNLYERMLAAKAPKRGVNRLQPIQQNESRTKLFAEQSHRDVSGEILRGTRLNGSSDRMPVASASAEQFALPWRPRAGQLPPIEFYDPAYPTENPQNHNAPLDDSRRSPKNKRTGSTVRISSAVGDDVRRQQRERVLFGSDQRPNTTHTMRSDTSLPAPKRLTPHSSFHASGRLSASNNMQLNLAKQATGNKTNNGTDNGMQPRDLIIEEETADELDDFVVWGRGPPLIPHTRRKGRSPWATTTR